MISAWARRRAGRGGHWTAAAVALATTLVLSGCSSESRAIGPDGPPTAATTAATTAAPAEVPEHGAEMLPPPLPHPADDPPSQDAALALGSQAVTAFARPDLSPDRWWAELSPLLSPAASVAYAGTDPVEVPARQVTGPARTGVSPSAFLATVFVPTDAGEYAVLMVREGGGAPWQVERITQVPAEPAQATPPGTEEEAP